MSWINISSNIGDSTYLNSSLGYALPPFLKQMQIPHIFDNDLLRKSKYIYECVLKDGKLSLNSNWFTLKMVYMWFDDFLPTSALKDMGWHPGKKDRRRIPPELSFG